MRILLFGSSGYVGSQFLSELDHRKHEVHCVSRQQFNDSVAGSATDLIKSYSPEYVINAAGYTGKPNVDACETDKTNCILGNIVLPGILAEACHDLDLPLGHISSGCIFTGSRPDGMGFKESDPPNFSFRQNNCSFYSGTKALGEEVLNQYPNIHVWRLRIPFSNVASPRNYLSKLINYQRLLDATNSLSELSEFTAAAIDCIEKKLPSGIYNLTNPGSVTTRRVVEIMKEEGFSAKAFEFFESEDSFMQTAASTPRSNCTLDSSKAISSGLTLSPVEDALRRAMQNWIEIDD